MQFRNVKWRSKEAPRFDPRMCARERSGEDHLAAESQRVGSVRLRWVDVYPIVVSKWRGIKPRPVREQRVASKIGDGRFEMQAASHRNRDDFVAERLQNLGELAYAFGVAPLGEANKKFPANAKYVTTFESSRQRDVGELSIFRERLRQRNGFAPPALRAEWQDHRQLIKNDGWVFDKHGIGKIRFGRKGNDTSAQFFEKRFVGVMLLLSSGQVNRFAIDKGKLAMDNGRADSARDRSKHDEERSVHDILLRDSEGAYRLSVAINEGAN